jgi:two-component system cell cycle sensor histidine kinase/response regulator CckA
MSYGWPWKFVFMVQPGQDMKEGQGMVVAPPSGKDSAYFLVDPGNGQVSNVFLSGGGLPSLDGPQTSRLDHWLRAPNPQVWQQFLQALHDRTTWTAPDGFLMRLGEKDWVEVDLSVAHLGGSRPLVLVHAEQRDAGLGDTWINMQDEGHHRLMLDNLGHSIFLKDRNLRFVAVNQAFCADLQRSAEEILGKDDFAFYPPALAEKYRADDEQVLKEGERLEIEEKTLREGKMRTVHVVKNPIYAADGSIRGILGIFWDVTEQRALEGQLRQAQKMEAVTQLAGGIAHDFNNLLTGILGNLDLARRELAKSEFPDPGRTPVLLAEAEKAAQKASELTRQLLSFSRRSQPRLVPLDLNTSVQEAIRTFRETLDSRITVHLHLAPHLWAIQADPGQIHQVLLHLAHNARDAMPRGGFLSLETANVNAVLGESDPIPLRNQPLRVTVKHPEGRPGDFVRLRCRDTGEGISPEVLKHLFEPYFTTKEFGKGAGLALAMVFGVVKEHQGWIECHSVPGEGTSFDLFLPRLMSLNMELKPEAHAAGHETILLVDDHEVVRSMARGILENHGYRVMTAGREAEAVAKFRENQEIIDLVLVDLTVPQHLGQETLMEIRGLKPQVNLLLSAAFPTGPARRAVETFGASGFVAKPYQPLELARAVRLSLDRRKTWL